MSDQTIHSPNESKGKAVMVGERGGLYTKDGVGNTDDTSQPQKRFLAPIRVLVGEGYDIAIFNESGGYKIYYKGARAKDIIERIRKAYMNSNSIYEAINKVV